MSTDNYPPGFNSKELDYSLEDLPEELLQVKYTLTVECGEDEEQVMKMSCFSEEELESSLIRKSRHAIVEWQNKELKYLIERFGDEDDL